MIGGSTYSNGVVVVWGGASVVVWTVVVSTVVVSTVVVAAVENMSGSGAAIVGPGPSGGGGGASVDPGGGGVVGGGGSAYTVSTAEPSTAPDVVSVPMMGGISASISAVASVPEPSHLLLNVGYSTSERPKVSAQTA